MRNVIVAVVISLALLVTLNTNAFAIVFTNTVNPDVFLSGTGTYSWSHLTPADFEVPFDTVNSATLTIDTFFVDGNNDQVSAQGVLQGTLNNGTWLFGWSETSMDIGDVFVTWPNGQNLNVTLNYSERGIINSLYLDSSTLRLDYDNGAAPVNSPVPEPATMSLLGIGVVGLLGLKRKRG